MRSICISWMTVGALMAPLCGCGVLPMQQRPVIVSQAPPTPAPVPDDPINPAGELPEGLRLFGDLPARQVPFDNQLVVNQDQHSFTSEGEDYDPHMDPSGRWLAFASTRHAPNPDVYIKSPRGSAMTQLTHDPAADIQPKFSPDGGRVVFASNRGGNWDIWMVRRNGTDLTQLTQSVSDELAPSWSPDGRQVAYTMWSKRERRWEIWTLDVEQPGIRKFLAHGMFPAWSPDGSRIAFQRARQRGSRWFSIWTIDLIEGEARHPTEIAYSEAAACISPAWSPDGTFLVYSAVNNRSTVVHPGSSAGLIADLWVVEYESGTRWKLTNGGAAAFNPTWGADGRVYFVGKQGTLENIWSLSPGVPVAGDMGIGDTASSAANTE